MRKLFALAMIAILALTLSLSLIGCGGAQQPESTTTETTTPPASESMPSMSDTTTMPDTAMTE